MPFMTSQKFKDLLLEHSADIKLNRCFTTIYSLNQKTENMINFKDVKIKKKLLSYQKLVTKSEKKLYVLLILPKMLRFRTSFQKFGIVY